MKHLFVLRSVECDLQGHLDSRGVERVEHLASVIEDIIGIEPDLLIISSSSANARETAKALVSFFGQCKFQIENILTTTDNNKPDLQGLLPLVKGWVVQHDVVILVTQKPEAEEFPVYFIVNAVPGARPNPNLLNIVEPGEAVWINKWGRRSILGQPGK